MGQFSYSISEFSFTGYVNSGADASTSESFTTRYYWHDANGDLAVMDSTLGPAITQSLGVSVAQPSDLLPAVGGAVPGVGFYGHGADEPIGIHAVRVDRLDPSA